MSIIFDQKSQYLLLTLKSVVNPALPEDASTKAILQLYNHLDRHF